MNPLCELARLRVVARRLIRIQKVCRTRPDVANAQEIDLQAGFLIIEIGQSLHDLCAAADAVATRAQIFEALEINMSQLESDDVKKYGETTIGLIAVLDLENSATRDDGNETKPLKWCHTMAFMNALKTSPKLDRIVHDGANEFLGGVFGEYRERPLMERLTGSAH